jgi:hypothetical protein
VCGGGVINLFLRMGNNRKKGLKTLSQKKKIQ